jgi:hypothetical protein
MSLVHLVDGAVSASLFRRVRERVARLGGERLEQTYQTTFWFPFHAPSAVTEEVILALRPLVPQKGVVGVEWWLSRMWTRDVQVDFHRDRNEALARRTGRQRHPRLSSVLFLNRVQGGALAVTAQRPDRRNPALAPWPLDADLVAPRPNRLAWFDGRLTHGVLDAQNQVPDRKLRQRGQLRMTLVMNWWPVRPSNVPEFAGTRVYAALRSRPRRAQASSGAARLKRSTPVAAR